MIVPTSACELQTTTGQQGLLAAGPVIGNLLGGIMWGYLGDTRGRRSMLLVSLVTGAAVNAVASISVNWIMLLVLQTLAAMFASGQYTLSMTLLSESVPLARRNLVVLLVASIFLLSQGIMAVLAIPIIPLAFSYYLPALDIYWNSWRTLMVVYSSPGLIVAPDQVPCSLNATSLLIILGIGVLQSVVNLVNSLIVNQVGRRNLAMFFTSLCGASAIVLNFVPNAIGSAALFAVLLIGLLLVGLYTAMTVALFPTHLRAMAVSLTMTSSRIGTFAGVQLLNFLLVNNCELGFYIFGAIIVLSAVVASFLPDDRYLRAAQPPSAPSQPRHNEELTKL